MGLPIVKKVIQDLNGEIQIESNPKKEPGTIITVILTKYEKPENEIVAHTTPAKTILNNIEEINLNEGVHHLNKQTILIVEDNISMVNYLFKKLKEKYNVYAALNGNEALKKIKNLTVLPDLIISDVMMDKVDGYAFAKIIFPNILRTIIYLLYSFPLNLQRMTNCKGLRLGAIDFIQKPFIINELLQKIESILINVGKQKQALLTSAFNHLNTQENLRKNPIDIFNQNCELYKLTSREKDIAKLICEGYKYKTIADTLFISERTVAKHVQNIFEKLQVSNKIELINKLEAS